MKEIQIQYKYKLNINSIVIQIQPKISSVKIAPFIQLFYKNV